MADRISETNYRAMIQALYNFSGRTNTLASEMQTLASVINSALSEEDNAVPAIYKQVRQCTLNYQALGKQAMAIAADIDSELKRAAEERQTWADDD